MSFRNRICLLLLLVSTCGWSQPGYSDFSSLTGLNVMGVAAQVGNVLRLTPSTAEVYGGVWYNTKQNISNGFITQFEFQITDTATITDGAGNGIAFVIQNDNANLSVGPMGTYYQMGDCNVQVGCSIEFRTSEKEGNYGAIPTNQVSVQTNGPTAANDIGYPTYTIASVVTSSFKDGSVHTVLINYTPGTLLVYLDNMSSPLLNVAVDFTIVKGGSILDASGNAWVGITAGTCGNSGAMGPCYETHDILSWSSAPQVKLKNDTICRNSVTRLFSTVTGGTQPLTYRWTPTVGLDSPLIARPLASPASTTTYTLTVTDAIGNAKSDVMTLTVNPKPSVVAGTGFTVCQGTLGNLNGQAATGGTPPYTYQWSPSSGVTNPNQVTTTAAPDVNTKYYLTVTDSKGCTGVDSVSVTVNAWPVLAAGDNSSTTICEGDSMLIGGAASGTGPFTYQWSPAVGLSATNIASPVAKPKNDITYSVVVTDSRGCQNHGSVVFFVKQAPHPRILALDTVLCAGDTTTLTSTDTNYTAFKWSSGETTKSIRVWRAGRYSVTATGPGGCKGTSPSDSITVLPRPAVPVITPNGPTTFCDGDEVTLNVPGGANVYQWSTGATGPFIKVKTSGTYRVTQIGSNGCGSVSLPIVVKVSPAPVPVIAGASVVCLNSSQTYSVSDSIANKYGWTVSPGGTITAGAGTRSITVLWTGAGPATLTVFDTSAITGCVGTATLPVNVGSSTRLKLTVKGDTILCGGDSVSLDAGAGYATYLWSNGATTQRITVTIAGTYSVKVSTAGGCQGFSDTVSVSIRSQLSPSLTGADTVCPNAAETYHTSNVAGRTYLWSVVGGAPLSGTTSDSVVVQWGGVGVGSVAVAVASGSCSGSTTRDIAIVGAVVPAIVANGPLTFCTGDSVTLSAPSGFASYLWSSGDTTESIVVHSSGTFTVAVARSSGCAGTSAPVTVTVGSALQPVISGGSAFCAGDSLTLDAGAGYTSYLWSTGATTQSVIVKSPGTYNVSVSRGSCSGTSLDLLVTQYPLPTPIIIVNVDTLTSSAANSYQWSVDGTPITGATSRTHIATQAGVYTVRVTDANGCSAVSTPYTYTVANLFADITIDPIAAVSPGTMFEVPIRLQSSQNFLVGSADHYVGALRYNGSMLIPIASRGGVLGTSQAVAGSTDRIVMFEGYRTSLTAGTLQWIACKALLGSDTCTTIAIDTFFWTDASVIVTRGAGTFCESGICLDGGTARRIISTGALALAAGSPNPANESIRFEYDLIETGPTRMVISDYLGKEVVDVQQTGQAAGHYVAEIPVSGLSAGCYVCMLRTPTQVVRQLFLIRR